MATNYLEQAEDGLPAAARFVVQLMPARDRESVVGDLLEDAAGRDLHGARRSAWLAWQCGAIAAGLSLERLRGAFVMPPVREVVSGLAIDGRGALRDGAAVTLLRVVVFVGSVATLALGVELLVATLMSAAGV